VGSISNILSVNGGSSSVKLAMFKAEVDQEPIEKLFDISLINIGQTDASIIIKDRHGESESLVVDGSDTDAAIGNLIDIIGEKAKDAYPTAIGSRFVRGGQHYYTSQPVTPNLEKDLGDIASFDPEHTSKSLQLVAELGKKFPGVQQYAIFDSAFFHNLPRIAQIIPLPHQYQDDGLRRYGFHGLSYSYLLSELKQIDESAANGRLIFAHLGSGASLAAISDGHPIDMTMGFTPASGIMMSSRSGDLDPGVVSFLSKQFGITIEEFSHMTNFESGLKGVSGISGDMKTLLDSEMSDHRAAEAVELFCYQVRKAIGALSAALGGVDQLVFTGGIGEQSAAIRSRICEGLEYLGIKLDESSNSRHQGQISDPDSQVSVRIIPADEALSIAREVKQLIA